MKKIFPLILSVLLLIGCAPTTKTTTTMLDDNGKVTGTITEEPVAETPFFESGNLNKFYEYEGSRVDKFNIMASKKIDFIKEQGTARQKDLQTPTERTLSNLVDTLLVAQIPTSPPPDGIAPPKTMVDFADKNLVPVASLALQGYGLGLFGDSAKIPKNDSSVAINNSGLGDVFYQSDNNKNPIYSIAGESSGYWDMGLNKGGDTTTKTDSSQKTLW